MITFFLWFFLFVAVFVACSCLILSYKADKLRRMAEKESMEAKEREAKAVEAYEKIKNAPKVVLEKAKATATKMLEDAQSQASKLLEKGNQFLEESKSNAARVVEAAVSQSNYILAESTAKFAQLQDKTKKKEALADALQNRIDGYADKYLIPIEGVMDKLANDLAHTQPANELRLVKNQLKKAIKRIGLSDSFIDEGDLNKSAKRLALDAFISKAESILEKLKGENYGFQKQKIIDSFTIVNECLNDFKISIDNDILSLYLEKLKWSSILLEMKRIQQEEQRLIREKMREEEKVRREAEKVQKEALKEEEMLQKALAIAYEKMGKASAEERTKFEQQINELNDRVALAEERRQRAISMAQQTRMGHVYVISNIGSFGDDVFKIGLTRRLVPQDRIDELGDSSVPFTFDVHAFIKSDDAPALEHQLHKHFILNQVNKVNHRKEFFRVPLSRIREEVEKLGLEANWTMTAEAIQFKESRYIDQLIESDPEAREKWIARQLELDDIDLESGFLESSEDEEE